MSPTELLERSPLLSQPPLAVAINIVVLVAVVLIVGAIVVDFRKYHHQDRRVVRSDRSLVETGSMAAFFLAYYAVIRLGIGQLLPPQSTRIATIAMGLALIVVGTAFNLWGRVVLKSAWANQIMIYENHELITSGPFAAVRHPLYASLVWAFVGGSLVYANPLSLLLVLGVFVPMMYVRARKEDALLLDQFGQEYEAYRSRTGMFLPKMRRRSCIT